MNSDSPAGHGLARGFIGLIVLVCCGSLLGLAGYWFVASRTAPAPADTPTVRSSKDKQQAELEERIRQLEKKVAAVRQVLDDLDNDRRDVLAKLRQSGVQSSADLKDNPAGQKQAARLQQIVQESDGLRIKLAEYEAAVEQAQAVLRRYERQLALKKAGITDEELIEVNTMIARIDEKLKGQSNLEATNPLKIEQVLEKELAQQPPPRATLKPDRPPPPVTKEQPLSKPPDDGRMTAALALAELKSGDRHRQGVACEWLVTAPVEAKLQKDIGEALAPLILLGDQNEDYLLWFAAANALGRWSVPDNVPAICGVVEKVQDSRIPGGLIALLGRLKDPRAAATVAPFLARGERGAAVTTLRTIGQAAEKEVVKYINHPDQDTANKARQLLDQFKSAPTLLLDQCLADLKAKEPSTRRQAAAWLAGATADPERRPTVAKALDPLLTELDLGVREAGARALTVWATRDNLPALLKIANDPNNHAHRLALQALGQVPDPQAAELLADTLSTGHRELAGRTLQTMGPAAEPVLLKRLDAANAGLRRQLCDILGAVGTAKSTPALSALAKGDPDQTVRRAAGLALQAIEQRESKED
jgi:HEAT repeat protein